MSRHSRYQPRERSANYIIKHLSTCRLWTVLSAQYFSTECLANLRIKCRSCSRDHCPRCSDLLSLSCSIESYFSLNNNKLFDATLATNCGGLSRSRAWWELRIKLSNDEESLTGLPFDLDIFFFFNKYSSSDPSFELWHCNSHEDKNTFYLSFIYQWRNARKNELNWIHNSPMCPRQYTVESALSPLKFSVQIHEAIASIAFMFLWMSLSLFSPETEAPNHDSSSNDGNIQFSTKTVVHFHDLSVRNVPSSDDARMPATTCNIVECDGTLWQRVKR